MRHILNIAALSGALVMPQTSTGQEIIPKVTQATSQAILVALSELPVRELRFSPALQTIPMYKENNGREIVYNFSLSGRKLRLSYTHGRNGGNFSQDFDVTHNNIPPEVVIPEDIQIPDFHISGNISGMLKYDYRRLELATQIRDGKYCDIWGGIGVTEYRFGVIAGIDAVGESEGITQNIQGTIGATGTDVLYNPSLSTDMNCRVSINERGKLLFNIALHGEIGNANAEFSFAYQHQLSPKIALGIGANIQYHDYYDKLENLSNFSDGWTDIDPHVSIELDKGNMSVSGIISNNGVGISVELFF